MASTLEFVQYVCGQMSGTEPVTYRKMFGEYGLYAYGKIFALICDNTVFLYPTTAGEALLPNAKTGAPYEGAKPNKIILEELDDPGFLARLVRETCMLLPAPKPKKPKKK